MYLVSLSAHLESVRIQSSYPFIVIFYNHRASVISFSYRPSPSSFSPGSQEGVHDKRGKAQPCQARQLRRDRMLRARRMPRKLACRCKGTIDIIYGFFPIKLRCHQDFFRPIVTPFELQLALQPSPMWTGEYVLDFDEVLTRVPPAPSLDNDEEADPDRPVFSLVTGRYRHAKRYGGWAALVSSSDSFFVKTLRHRSRWDTCPSVVINRTYLQGSGWHGHNAQGQCCRHALSSLYAIHWTESSLKKVNSCNHARSVVSRHVLGLIRLASFNKDGPVSREGMVTTIVPRMPDDTIDCVKIYRDVEQTAMLRLASTLRNI